MQRVNHRDDVTGVACGWLAVSAEAQQAALTPQPRAPSKYLGTGKGTNTADNSTARYLDTYTAAIHTTISTWPTTLSDHI